ncbi:MAG: DUF2237 domain-containing protein [Chromatiaceae bacterium]|jgi:hypothetical protein
MGEASRNALGGPLQVCGLDPKTGYFRDGSCRTQADDQGRHVVCAEVTDEFLAFSRSQGNDLITPQPAFGFPGLKAGDRWCLCAMRWHEAHEAGVAPPIYLQASHERLLEIVALDVLLPYAKDLPRHS